MTLYKVSDKQILRIQKSTFAQQNLKERNDLQDMLKKQIEIISPDTLIIAEEFCHWENSQRRIDLLGIDKEANLIVIELKRSEEGGYMDLQSIRYAAMISTLTFAKLLPVYAHYLETNGIQQDAQSSLLEFLDWSGPDEENFAKEVKIILASADFSKELTTSVMWLNDFGLDIKCIKMNPYSLNNETILDIQTVIPLPEAVDYQIQVREKKQREREARTQSRDFTKFDVTINNKSFKALNKRRMVFHTVDELLKMGIKPQSIMRILPKPKFKVYDGHLNIDQVYEKIMVEDKGGSLPNSKRYFINDGEFFYIGENTFVLSNQWGKGTTGYMMEFQRLFAEASIEFSPTRFMA